LYVEKTCNGSTTTVFSNPNHLAFGHTFATIQIYMGPGSSGVIQSMQVYNMGIFQTITIPSPNGTSSTLLAAYLNSLNLGATFTSTTNYVNMLVKTTNTGGIYPALTFVRNGLTYNYSQINGYTNTVGSGSSYNTPCGAINYYKTFYDPNFPTVIVTSYNSVSYSACNTINFSSIPMDPSVIQTRTCGCN